MEGYSLGFGPNFNIYSENMNSCHISHGSKDAWKLRLPRSAAEKQY